MRFWSLLWLACGCDRVFLGSNDQVRDGMPPIIDAGDSDMDGFPDDVDNCPDLSSLNQHDEDGDGVGDVCDNCPHLMNRDQANTDNDGLGDACESPNNAFDCISHFDAFTSLPSLDNSKGPWGLVDGDSVAAASESGIDSLLYVDANSYDDPLIITAGKVTALGVSTDYNNAAVWGEAGVGQTVLGVPNNGFVAEMTRAATSPIDNTRPGMHTALRTNAMGSNGAFVPFVPSQGAMAIGARFQIELDMRLTTTMVATVRMNGGAPATGMTTIAKMPGNRVALRTNRMSATFDYVLVVEPTAGSCPPRR